MAKTKTAQEFKRDRRNANRGTDRGRAMVEASLREVGAGRSILSDRAGNIIAGNKTLAAAESMGLKLRVIETDGKELVVVQRNDLDLTDDAGPARKMAYLDNRASEVGLAWDAEVLLADLNNGLSFDGLFDKAELDALLAGLVTPEPVQDPGPQIDKAEELRVKWDVSLGQLWQIGKHRLICGDCTDKATVARLMGGEKAQATVTDPPYGTASGSKVQKRGDRIETFDIEWDKEAPTNWIPIMFECLDDGAAVTSFWDNKAITRLWDSLEDAGFNPMQTVYWKKTTVPQPRPNFCSSIESAVFARKPGKVLCWNGGGATPNVFDANRAAGNERVAHETQKPLSLFSWLIELITEKDHTVYEPFSGSGTTLIACEQLSRQCRAIEISPAYVAVALQRWADATGQTPVLSGERTSYSDRAVIDE